MRTRSRCTTTPRSRGASPRPWPSRSPIAASRRPCRRQARSRRSTPRSWLEAASISVSNSASVLLSVLVLACACATPVRVNRAGAQSVDRSLSANVLSTGGTPGPYSQQLLRRLGISERFETHPEAVLAGLRGSGAGLDREFLFALAELSFAHAEKNHLREYYLAAAVYAYAFLFTDPAALNADPIDPRLQLAANLYNRSEEHTSELQSRLHLVCRLLLEKKKKNK